MKKYKRKKKGGVRAIRFTGDNWREIKNALPRGSATLRWTYEDDPNDPPPRATFEGTGTGPVTVSSGEWLVIEEDGTLHACKTADFMSTFEEETPE